MSDEDAPVSPDGEHVLPPPPIPAADMGRYRSTRDPDSEQGVVRYVEIEARGEKVEHVELVKRETVAGGVYDVWDVVTDKDRYWVLSNLTNLYSQKLFPSLDFTLSFHVGLMMRIRSGARGVEANDPSPFDEVVRRMDQANDLNDRAIEAEAYQAVANQLRECLLALLPAMRRRVPTVEDEPTLKAGDFKGWYERLADALCPGASNAPLRQYLKRAAKDTWDLVSWLVHYKEADKAASTIALQACQNVVGHSVQILERAAESFTSKCPVCGSRDTRTHYDPFIGSDGDYYATCGVCGWSSHPGEPDEAEAHEL
jgi:hypothetical protein